MTRYILTLACRDQLGIVAAVSGFLAEQGGFILSSQQFGDTSTGNFFMRLTFFFQRKTTAEEDFRNGFEGIANHFEMEWHLRPENSNPRVLILVSKWGHCLNTLLNKAAMGTLQIEIPAIVSNHPDLGEMAKWYATPFYHFPVSSHTKSSQEKKILDLIQNERIDVVVLARYMQIFTDQFVEKTRGKVINIHHSFLPSFKGSRPYHQAFEKGVKLIGATAHYVSEDLDEGPIIEQEVVRVDHSLSPEELVTIGQDIESITLARAVKWHAQGRIFLNGNKTIVFR